MSLSHRITPLAAVLSACLLLPTSSYGQFSFQNHQVTTTGTAAIALHADFNGDGREDLLSGRTLLLSNGDGTYQAPIAVPASVDAIGDFNEDGKLDFLSYLSVNGPVAPTLYLGEGNGTFQTGKVVTGAGPAPDTGSFHLVVADVNHDSKSDFVTVNEVKDNGLQGFTENVQIWLSKGDGTFTRGQSLATQVPDADYTNLLVGQVLTGDFDGDGKPDLAIVYELYYGPTLVQILYGDGAGNLGASAYLVDPNSYFDGPFAVADVNNDGKEDLVGQTGGFVDRAYQGNPLLALFAGNGNRTLTYSTIATSQCPGTPAVADFNGDGINDLAYNVSSCATSPDPSGFMAYVVAAGKGQGTFGPEQTVAQSSFGGYDPTALRSTTGTRPDLAYTQLLPGSNSPTNILLLSNTTDGSFPGCELSGIAEGVQICAPATSSSAPVKFSIAAAGPTPMRTAAVWVDGKKVAEQLTHSFSSYSFLDASLPLTAGNHAVTVYGTGWDNTLQERGFTLNVGNFSACPPITNEVNLCAPTNGATVSSPVTIVATSGIQNPLARMEVWIDGVKKYTETTSPTLSFTISLAPGSHRFAVFADDTTGGKTETFDYATVK